MSLILARKIMANMPDEVFNIWLAGLIGKDGTRDQWPFTNPLQSTSGTVWSQYFDGHSIQTISQLRWERKQILGYAALFGPMSQKRMVWIINAHMKGLKTPCANLKNGGGKASFLRSRTFIARTGRLHTPAILIQQIQGYQIMDGNHRLAAFFSIPNVGGYLLDCWIGHSEKL